MSELTQTRGSKTMKNLQGKYAVVFGAGGSVGAAVAKEFAAEGAEVFLAGRTDADFQAWRYQRDVTA